MENVYLDNAATTAIRPEVIAEMATSMATVIGNPSSTHSFGRQAKSVLENSRKVIAKNINAFSNEIIFTSGATEAINWILNNAVNKLGVTHFITSKTEHHAVLDTLKKIQTEKAITVDYVTVNEFGIISYTHLVSLLDFNTPTLVCLMHVNNEIGSLLDLQKVSTICKQHNAYFMSDTVQSIGKFVLDVQQLQIDFLVASAHKFHGPKGVGFLYKKKNILLQSLYKGGEQEKGLRAGTENVHNISGMATALSCSYNQLSSENNHIENLKKYTIEQLFANFKGIKINGDVQHTSNHILNVALPFTPDKSSMILFYLDMKGIAISRGSACQSGSNRTSHVLQEILSPEDLEKPSIRISFSYQNTFEDIDALINALKTI